MARVVCTRAAGAGVGIGADVNGSAGAGVGAGVGVRVGRVVGTGLTAGRCTTDTDDAGCRIQPRSAGDCFQQKMAATDGTSRWWSAAPFATFVSSRPTRYGANQIASSISDPITSRGVPT